MNDPVLILYLEDNPFDVELVRDKLQQTTSLACELRVAAGRAEYEAALAQTRFDLILSDYTLPDYDGLAALALARTQQPEIPFILISGTLGEEKAVDCLLRGATDYLLKQRLDRLVPAVLRALAEAEENKKRRAAEAELRFRNVILSTQQEASLDGILVVDEHGGIISSNRRFADMWGLPADIVASNSDERALQAVRDKLANPDEFASLVKHLHEARDENSREEVALKDGRTFDRYSAPMLGAGGKCYGRVWYFRDLTERKQAEAALRESEEKFRKVFEEGPLGMVMTSGSNAQFLMANAAFCQMLGYTEAELKRLTFVDVTHPDHRPADVEGVSRMWAGQIPRYQTEKRYLKKNGETFWGALTAAAIRGEDGTPLYHLAMIEDITARKQAEAALHNLSLQLSRAEDAERRRIARELHDSTGQKLAALSMNFGLLWDAVDAHTGKTDKLFADCFATLEQCAQEIRTQSYMLHPPLLDELGLAVALRNYIAGFSKRSGVPVAFDAPPDLERLPDAVELALFRVVQESLGNIHAHAGATTARVRLARSAAQVTLEVSDQGCGLSAEKRRALEAGHGEAGVGIAGMRERLRLLGGRLEIESDGPGTTVRASLPRRQETI
jgi:PAS domain S-box-containing protein